MPYSLYVFGHIFHWDLLNYDPICVEPMKSSHTVQWTAKKEKKNAIRPRKYAHTGLLNLHVNAYFVAWHLIKNFYIHNQRVIQQSVHASKSKRCVPIQAQVENTNSTVNLDCTENSLTECMLVSIGCWFKPWLIHLFQIMICFLLWSFRSVVHDIESVNWLTWQLS